jgi:hypothetical protein
MLSQSSKEINTHKIHFKGIGYILRSPVSPIPVSEALFVFL